MHEFNKKIVRYYYAKQLWSLVVGAFIGIGLFKKLFLFIPVAMLVYGIYLYDAEIDVQRELKYQADNDNSIKKWYYK